MSKKVEITVYIPSKNYGHYLQEAIESVLKQTVDNWELFLIDDNSTDNTKDIINLYRSDPRIKIFNTDSVGLPTIANLVLKRSKGKYVIRLDADDVFDENILLVLSHYLERNKDIALVFPDYFLVDDDGGIIRYEGRQKIYEYNHLLDVPAHGACTMIRREVLEELGGYREDLGAQDGFDLWVKVQKKYKSGNVCIPLFFYRRHGSNLTDNTVRILSARRHIKQEASQIDFEKFRPIVSVIPCRRYYDFTPDLWKKKVGDEKLLDIAIKTSLASRVFDMIVVTCDNEKVTDVLRKYNDSRLRFVKRSRESTTISKSIVETLISINEQLHLGHQGISVLSYIQTPLVTTASLEESVNTLILNDADSAFAVAENNESLFRRSPHGLIPVSPVGNRVRSDFDIIYAASLSSAAIRNSNLKNGSLSGSRVAHFTIPHRENFFLNAPIDLKIASVLRRG